MVKRLYDCLRQQLDLYKELLQLSQDKQQQIVTNNLEGLQGIIQREEDIIKKLSQVEQQRVAEAALIQERLGLPKGEITVTDILEQLKEDDRIEGEELVLELSNLLGVLAQLNKTNGELVEHSLRFVNQNLELLTDLGAGGQSYRRDGKSSEERSKRSILDQKA